MIKQSKKKTCSHSRTYNKFDNEGLHIICNFCHQEVNAPGPGIHKQSSAQMGASANTSKAGYEKQDPRVQKAEKLKSKAQALKIKIKQTKDKSELALLKEKLGIVDMEMSELQSTYED